MASSPPAVPLGDDGIGEPIYPRRHIRIICIGAGASGLLFAYKLQKSFDNFSLKIYEKNAGIGGAWFENKYPGSVACDYPAHNYTYTFEPKPDWPSVYVSGAQVRQYFEDFSVKYQLARYCQTGSEVTRAQWKEAEGYWRVEVRHLATGGTATDDCEILISATGVLNQPKWPDIPGLDKFQGQLIHSAKWDESVDLKGTRVGLIGNGFSSSGQQILETIQPIVGHLTSFIRQGTWTFGPFGPSPPRTYTISEIDNFKNDPAALTTLRKASEARVNRSFPLFLSSSAAQAKLRSQLTGEMKSQLQNPELEAILIPTTGVGCRRPTPGLNYLSAVTAPNVTIAYGPISHITPHGATCANNPSIHHEIDVLICATGFNTSYAPRFPICNAAGTNLQDEWSPSQSIKPAAYLATAAPKLPKYLMFFGPGNPWASGSFLSMIEAQAEYMLKLVDRFQSENWHSFAPKREAVEDFMEHAERVLKETVWVEGCNSWYKREGGVGKKQRIVSEPEVVDEAARRLEAARSLNLWPGSGVHFIESLADLRADDWEIRYKGNRFDWLGNGFSRTEMDPESDIAWYIREKDNGSYLSREKRRSFRTSTAFQGEYGMAI